MPTAAEISAMYQALTASKTCSHAWVLHHSLTKRMKRLINCRRLSKRARQLKQMRRARKRA